MQLLKTFSLAALLVSSAFAYEAHNIEVEFTAFKTYLKKGVKGKFEKVTLHSQKADSLEAMLLNTAVTIDTKSINSGNKARDAKLVNKFFLVQNNGSIEAKIVKVDPKTLTIALTLNGITKNVPLKYEVEHDEVEAKGVIDLGDFDMLPSLRSINKACYALHQGKTWQDVDIEFELTFDK